MGAYICGICDNMFCSHSVSFFYCEKCNTAFCEDCWNDTFIENDIDYDYNTCGNCLAKIEKQGT